MVNLEKKVKELMRGGIYHPDALFKALYYQYDVHYSRVREAIHNAKQD